MLDAATFGTVFIGDEVCHDATGGVPVAKLVMLAKQRMGLRLEAQGDWANLRAPTRAPASS